MNCFARGVVLGLAALWPCLGHGAVYKCAGNTGPVYQETPCPAGRQLRDFTADPPPLSIIPGMEPAGAVPAPSTARARVSETARSASERTGKKLRGDPAQRRFAHTGMSESEVLAQLGRPDVTARGAGKGARTRWSYLPATGDPETITTLYLAGGTVVDVERKLVKR